MADAPLVITDASGEVKPSMDGIFSGLAFFVTQRTPFRTRYVERIQNNGGRVVRVEDQASFIICDHVRRDAPAGGHSYSMIDDAITEGGMPNPEKYIVAPRPVAVRTIGAGKPARATRTPFTPEDDRILWNFVRQAEENGEAVQGNIIYQRLAAINPRHTFQSWRDRFVKRLINLPDDSFPPEEASGAAASQEQSAAQAALPAAPDSDPTASGALLAPSTDAAPEKDPSLDGRPATKKRSFDSASAQQNPPREQDPRDLADIEQLLAVAADVIDIPPKQRKDAWKAWHASFPTRTALQWQKFFDTRVRPIYEASIGSQDAKRRRTKPSDVDSVVSDADAADAIHGESHPAELADGDEDDNQDETVMQDENGAALTEQNLADQQAQHDSHHHYGTESPENDLGTSQAPVAGKARIANRQNPDLQDNADVNSSEENLPGWHSSAAEIEFSQYLQDKSPWPSSVGRSPAPGEAAVRKPVEAREDVNYDPDLTLPEPDGGFDENTTPRQSLAKNARAPGRAARSGTVLETQDIYDIESQDYDLAIPLPPQSQHESIQKDTAASRKSNNIEGGADADVLDEDMDSWMARMTQEGHTAPSIVSSLKCTSMRPDLAEYVLLETKYGRGVPSDVPGIWSELDDLELEGGDARRLRAIEEKHGGWEEIQLRRKFLEDFRDLS